MKTNYIYTKITFVAIIVISLLMTACTDDLDRYPGNKKTGEDVYKDVDGYNAAATKVYASLALTGNKGAAGEPDIAGMDEGSYTSLIRSLFYLQELPTDEALCTWTQDLGVEGVNSINFSGENPIIRGMYYRLGINITYANDFIKHCDESTLDSKGFTTTQKQELYELRDEVRFLRSYFYYMMIDLFGNPPFFTETHKTGTRPTQGDRKQVFEYIESELLDIIGTNGHLKDARAQIYGRVDKGVAWALLARLYLNAEVYTGEAHYNEAAEYAEKVINAGYTLKSNYEELFLADNNLNNPEIILSINFDGNETKSFGGTTFLINCAFNATIQSKYNLNYGISTNAGWGGIRSRAQLSQKFGDTDKRNLFVGDVAHIDQVTEFMQGKATYKYRNITSTGTPGSNSEFADVDFPAFRLAEMYLTYTEAVVRGGAGSSSNALSYMNLLRERAFGNSGNNYNTYSQLTLDELLNERARELYWECHRRTDLIRYNYFTTSNYIWEWKGNVKEGKAVDNHFNMYPIPNTDLAANPNLKQNTGYK